jgi:sirohydrochlorin cobaltochelatase
MWSIWKPNPGRITRAKQESTGMNAKIGLLLVGHGTSSILGTAEFCSVVAALRQRFPTFPIAFGFLELALPSIDQAVELLYQQGVSSILTAPILLFAAGHAKVDIPSAVQAAASRRGLSVATQAEVFNCHPRLIQLSLRRYQQAARNSATDLPQREPVQDAAFVLVGRGNRDPLAQQSAAQFLAECKSQGNLKLTRLAFLAIAKPDLNDVLEDLGTAKTSHCVVVPHLLFHGELVAKCQTIVNMLPARFPNTRWSLAQRLGPSAEVISAAADRIEAALENQPLPSQ